VSFRDIGVPVLGTAGITTHTQTNLTEIAPLLDYIKTQRALLAEMVHSPFTCETMRANCAAMLAEVRERSANFFRRHEIDEAFGVEDEDADGVPRIAAARAKV
jgi:hypothetical protein